MRKKLGIYEAKTHLSKIIRMVQKHNVSFEITDRGTTVAVLAPAAVGANAQSVAERIEELALAGIIDLPKRSGRIKPIADRPGALERFLAERD